VVQKVDHKSIQAPKQKKKLQLIWQRGVGSGPRAFVSRGHYAQRFGGLNHEQIADF
jgi:hypothetical protein